MVRVPTVEFGQYILSQFGQEGTSSSTEAKKCTPWTGGSSNRYFTWLSESPFGWGTETIVN